MLISKKWSIPAMSGSPPGQGSKSGGSPRQASITSHMAAYAARNAMDQAGVHPTEIDLIIVATVTPDTYLSVDCLPCAAVAWSR